MSPLVLSPLPPTLLKTLVATTPFTSITTSMEEGLNDLPELATTAEGAARLRNGNPGMVFANDVEYGDEAWASLDGKAVAVGIYKSGELHPSRVFVA